MAEGTPALEQGMQASERGDWEQACDWFRSAIAAEADCAPAYEGLSWAAWSLDDVDLVFHAREEAFRLYSKSADGASAARMALWLSSDHIDFRGDLAVANGWLQRAHRILADLAPVPEHAWILVMEADVALLVEEDTLKAKTLAQDARKIARDLGVSDVVALSLSTEGLALVSEGDIAAGMRLLDEAAASALNGELSEPGYVGWALCYLIFACERVRDYDRAREWCEKMLGYAERSGMSVVRGICRVHLAGVFIWRGDWLSAEEELSEAAAQLKLRPVVAAEGTVRLADLRHRQGRIAESETLFREVEWHPLALLGLAELALEAGSPRDADELIDRFLRQVPESSRTQRSTAFELQVRAKALLGDHAAASTALAAICDLSVTVATPPLRAAARFSTGALAVAERDYSGAQVAFEDAVSLYERCAAPYEAARARLELASVLVMLERLPRAQAEAAAAHKALEGLNSTFHASRAAALKQDIARRQGNSDAVLSPISPLTERQVEILRLIARGLNDHEIAVALTVSEHTVHRHVANILQRLDLPSRAAAVAYAGTRGLI